MHGVMWSSDSRAFDVFFQLGPSQERSFRVAILQLLRPTAATLTQIRRLAASSMEKDDLSDDWIKEPDVARGHAGHGGKAH